MATDTETLIRTAQLSKAAGVLAIDMYSYRITRDQREGTDYSKLSIAELDRLMVALLSHTIEEVVELLMCLPNRKAWKAQDSASLRSPGASEQKAQALEEMADIVLMLDAFREAAGFTMEEAIGAIHAKIAKNLARADHVCNATH